MTFTPTPLNGAYVIDLSLFSDGRGWFARTFCKHEFEQIGHTGEWVQMNHSMSIETGAVRGMHFQHPPFREVKMVRCIAGSVYDVIVDLRKDSASFLQWFGIELSAKNRKMLYIPEGFAHGFQVLSGNSELIYHHTEYYNPASEAGVLYNDPAIGIQWPLPVTVLSDRDRQHPFLQENFKGI